MQFAHISLKSKLVSPKYTLSAHHSIQYASAEKAPVLKAVRSPDIQHRGQKLATRLGGEVVRDNISSKEYRSPRDVSEYQHCADF